MSSSLSRPPYSWFLSVSLFSCRIVPLNSKMSLVTEQSISFPQTILHLFSYFFSGSSWMSKRLGNPSFLHVLLHFPHVSVSSGNSSGITFPSSSSSSSLTALPSFLLQDCLWVNKLLPVQELSDLGNLQGRQRTTQKCEEQKEERTLRMSLDMAKDDLNGQVQLGEWQWVGRRVMIDSMAPKDSSTRGRTSHHAWSECEILLAGFGSFFFEAGVSSCQRMPEQTKHLF